jgi:hypothetical protein
MGEYNAPTTKEDATVGGTLYADVVVLAFDYIFAPQTGTTVTFSATAFDAANNQIGYRELPNIPIERNKLTTIIGNFFTNTAEMTVIVGDEFDSENEIDGNAIKALLDARAKLQNLVTRIHSAVWVLGVYTPLAPELPKAKGFVLTYPEESILWQRETDGTRKDILGYGLLHAIAEVTGNEDAPRIVDPTLTPDMATIDAATDKMLGIIENIIDLVTVRRQLPVLVTDVQRYYRHGFGFADLNYMILRAYLETLGVDTDGEPFIEKALYTSLDAAAALVAADVKDFSTLNDAFNALQTAFDAFDAAVNVFRTQVLFTDNEFINVTDQAGADAWKTATTNDQSANVTWVPEGLQIDFTTTAGNQLRQNLTGNGVLSDEHAAINFANGFTLEVDTYLMPGSRVGYGMAMSGYSVWVTLATNTTIEFGGGATPGVFNGRPAVSGDLKIVYSVTEGPATGNGQETRPEFRVKIYDSSNNVIVNESAVYHARIFRRADGTINGTIVRPHQFFFENVNVGSSMILKGMTLTPN